MKSILRVALAMLVTQLSVGPAFAAEWWLAETGQFRVYSEAGEQEAIDIATRLERVDLAMRVYTGVAYDVDRELPEEAKVSLFQFGDDDDIGDLAGQRGVLGFFIPRAGGSVAFIPVEVDKRRGYASPGSRSNYALMENTIAVQQVLQHEYFHYFMFQHSPAAYPAWYIEGLAEVFGMLRIEDNTFYLGDPPPARMASIKQVRPNANLMFGTSAANLREYPVYAHGWLATNYLSFEPSRKGQLAEYLKLINQGVDGLEAAKQAFGDLGKLSRELAEYRDARILGIAVPFPPNSNPDVKVRKLSADEAARMMMMIESKAGVTRSKAREQVKDAKQLLEQYPNSVPVLLAALEVEFDATNYTKAQGLVDRILAIDPEEEKAKLYEAWIALEYAKKDPNWLSKARSAFVAANRINPIEPNALVGYYLTYAYADEKAPEAAIIGLEEAYRTAPFDPGIRTLLAHLLLTEGKDEQAIAVLGPLMNSPHSSDEAEELRGLVDKARAGDRQPLIDKLKPKLNDKDED